MTVSDRPSAPGPRLGKFLLEKRIASGGMADVYLARQLGAFGFAKTVALKVLRSEVAEDGDHVRMFLREALVAAEFHHPNLAQVYEVGEERHHLYIAMELVRGLSVAALMYALALKGRSIPIPLAARIALACLDGLAHAHEALGPEGAPLRLVHRDVTPQNILVDVEGGVKVVDFGIARAETVLGRTQAHRIKGKFSYMAPEQWEPGKDIDARADLFGLGVVLYEMSTGSGRLFKGAGAAELYRAVLLDPIPPPSSRVPDYPPALAEVVMRALERNPAARWPSARAMHSALARVMEAQGWNVTEHALARLVEVALDGEPLEQRWEPVTAQELPAIRDDEATVVEDPASLGPRPYSLPPLFSGEAPRDLGPLGLEGDPEGVRRVRLALLSAALLGWLSAGGAAGLYLREKARVRTLTSTVALETARANAVQTSSPTVPSAGVVIRAEPALSAAVGASWLGLVSERLAGTAVRFEAGDTLDPVLSGEVAALLRAGVADAAATRSAEGLGIVLHAPASEHVVGYDHAVVIVHPSNRLGAITLSQLAALYSRPSRAFPGRGARGAPRVLACGAGTSIQGVLRDVVLRGQAPGPHVELTVSEARTRELVASDPRAIGLVRLAWVGPGVAVVPVARDARDAAVSPTRESVRGLSYPLARPVVVYTRGAPTGAARALLDVAYSPGGQAVLERSGYVSR